MRVSQSYRAVARSLHHATRRPLRYHLIPSRQATTYSTPAVRFRESVKNAQKQSPVLFPVLLIAACGSVSLLGLFAYDELTKIAPQYAAYPAPVEKSLRLALHFTHVQPDPDTASKYFIEAIKAAEENEMHPFSKESLGIRIRFSEMLEKFGHVKAALEILNKITKDCEDKLAEVDASPETTSETPRKDLLRLIIETKVKASSLYDGDYVQDSATAKQILSDAVGLLVKETSDSRSQGFSEDNAAGLSMGEIASILSQMGDLYATSGEEANAVQVYMLTLQPLRAICNGVKSCKEVQIFSNIAATMALAIRKPSAKINGKPVTQETFAAARQAVLKWTDQAIATADLVKPEDRDEICELSLLSAQMTRADLLLEAGDKNASKEVFTSLLPTLREKGLATLVKVAEQGLRNTST